MLELRITEKREDGIFGSLIADDVKIGVFCTQAFPDGMGGLASLFVPGVSYVCERTVFHRGGYDTYEIKVSGHSRVLFHVGNTDLDTAGCVLPGTKFGKLLGLDAVVNSKAAFDKFMAWADGAHSFGLVATDFSADPVLANEFEVATGEPLPQQSEQAAS